LLFATTALAVLALASSVPVSHTHPRLDGDWSHLGLAPPSTPISLRLDLKQRNLNELEARLWAVSDPDSPMYGAYMSNREVTQLVSPLEAEMAPLLQWVASVSCLSHHEHRGDYMWLEMPAQCATELFGADMHLYGANSTTTPTRMRVVDNVPRRVIARSRVAVVLPEAWEGIVQGVRGLVQLPPAHTRFVAQSAPLGKSPYPGDEMTPLTIAKAYGINAKGSNGEAVAVAEFEDSAFYPSDIQLFLANYSLPTANISRIVGEDDVFDGYLAEASLDVQYMMSLSPGIAAWAFMRGSFDLTSWALNVSGTEGAPKVHSISYGSKETAFEVADMERDNTEFQKLGVQGHTILVASGDSGTGHQGIFRCKGFAPNFPSTSPYVTSVGGTYISASDEKSWNYSGGGFSTAFPMPAYQQEKVAAYLQSQGTSLPDSSLFNASNRAVPDISAVATNFNVLMQGFWDNQASGTSASAPVWAAIFSLINDARTGLKKPPLGFVNPALYKLTSVGRDITSGEPNQDKPCKAGFAPAAGWDATSGLGSPIFSMLMSELAK